MDIPVAYLEADRDWRHRVNKEWGEKAAQHMHFDDGFTVIATHDHQLVGMIAVYWRSLPEPLSATQEGFIDIVEVDQIYRRRGIASRLIEMAIDKAIAHGAYQIQAWSSEDKFEAIPMWQALGFGLAPAVVFQDDLEIRGFYAVKAL